MNKYKLILRKAPKDGDTVTVDRRVYTFGKDVDIPVTVYAREVSDTLTDAGSYWVKDE